MHERHIWNFRFPFLKHGTVDTRSSLILKYNQNLDKLQQIHFLVHYQTLQKRKETSMRRKKDSKLNLVLGTWAVSKYKRVSLIENVHITNFISAERWPSLKCKACIPALFQYTQRGLNCFQFSNSLWLPADTKEKKILHEKNTSHILDPQKSYRLQTT